MILRIVRPGRERDVDQDLRSDLSPRARTVGVVVWCSFLAASAATTVTFAFIDPIGIAEGLLGDAMPSHSAIYALGFFFFWVICAVSSALTIYMAHTDPAT